MIPRVPERWRRRHPLVLGVGEGLVAAGLLAMAWALGLSMLAGVAWVIIVWAAMAAARPSTYQALVAIALALVFDAMSGAPMGARMLPLAGALLAGSFAPGPVMRWGVSHGVFALYALGGYFAVEMLLAALGGSGGLLAARLIEFALSFIVIMTCGIVIAVRRHWSQGRVEGVGHRVPVLLRSLR